MPDATPRLDALLLLEAYQTAHSKGNADLKSSMWSLTKARREKPDIAASNVRQELDPLVRIDQHTRSINESDEEPELIQEKLSLVDVIQKRQLEKENESVSLPGAKNAVDDSIGLRNRHSKKGPTSTTSEKSSKPAMTREDLVDETIFPDPIQLLGGALPPRSLLHAQTKAKEALESYVQAANIVQELQKILAAKRGE